MRLPTMIASLLLAGCNVAPPVPERPGEASRKATENHQLRDTIQQPVDRARSANEPVEKADEERARALEDAEG